MKLIYPEDGIYNKINSNNREAISNLERALLKLDFVVPSDFGYRSYLNNLDENIRRIKKSIEIINEKVKINDNYLENTVNELLKRCSNLNNDRFKVREGIIK